MSILLTAAPVPAAAHADYARSSPAAGETVRTAPARLDVWFTQDLFNRPDANRLQVVAPNGAAVHLGAATLDEGDRTHLFVALLEPLPAGEYTVQWATLSATDGDPKEGSFSFRVDPAAPTRTPTVAAATSANSPSATPPAASEQARQSAVPWWAVGALAAIVSSGAVVAGLLLRGDDSL